jgi:hypothetical protein
MRTIPLTSDENKRMREDTISDIDIMARRPRVTKRPTESTRRDLIDALRLLRGIETKLKLVLDLDT